jgi:hypothetical protein
MPKRDLSKSRKLPAVDTAAHDAETVRLVAEFVEMETLLLDIFDGMWHKKYIKGARYATNRIAAILNRKPAAKKERKRG